MKLIGVLFLLSLSLHSFGEQKKKLFSCKVRAVSGSQNSLTDGEIYEAKSLEKQDEACMKAARNAGCFDLTEEKELKALARKLSPSEILGATNKSKIEFAKSISDDLETLRNATAETTLCFPVFNKDKS